MSAAGGIDPIKVVFCDDNDLFDRNHAELLGRIGELPRAPESCWISSKVFEYCGKDEEGRHDPRR